MLHYTGQFDPEIPPFMKVLKVTPATDQAGPVIVAGDQKGGIHKIPGYEVFKGGMPEKKKPASWQATR